MIKNIKYEICDDLSGACLNRNKTHNYFYNAEIEKYFKFNIEGMIGFIIFPLLNCQIKNNSLFDKGDTIINDMLRVSSFYHLINMDEYDYYKDDGIWQCIIKYNNFSDIIVPFDFKDCEYILCNEVELIRKLNYKEFNNLY